MPSRTFRVMPGTNYDADLPSKRVLTIYCNSSVPQWNILAYYAAHNSSVVVHQGPILIPTSVVVQGGARVTANAHTDPDQGPWPEFTYLQVIDE